MEDKLASCRTLPTLPGAAIRLIEVAQSPDADVASAVAVISLDPALSAKILRLANSPLYATQRRVDNLRQALTLLGLNTTLNLALGFSLVGALRTDGASAALNERLWRRSILASIACRTLGNMLRLPRTDELMLAGLMQDVGMLALGKLDPEGYAARVEASADPADQCRREVEAYGIDHAAAGAWLARHWSLPRYLEEAIGHSETQGNGAPFNRCVALSGRIADLWIVDSPEDLRREVSDQAQALLGMSRADFADLTSRIAESVPEMASVFDIRLTEPARAQALLEHAQELIALRNLREIHRNAQLREEAERLRDHARAAEETARRDPLTGLYNRAHFEPELARHFDEARRFGWPLALAFIDLDAFKQINDRYGHLVGDEVLRQFAAILRASVRHEDVVCRYGGEEFLILLPGTSAVAAHKLMQRLLLAIAETPLSESGDALVRVTGSVGLAVNDDGQGWSSARAMLEAADRALYGAKEDGRNRLIVVHPDDAPAGG